jgi:hypothetical protein
MFDHVANDVVRFRDLIQNDLMERKFKFVNNNVPK